MSNGIERAQGGRVIPALRYRNGQAAIRFVRAPEPPERIKTQGIYVVVADVKAAGAEILLDLKTQTMAGATTQP
jgi:hypothetical protein